MQPAPAPRPPSAPHLRPVAHFTCRRSWLNDPNGLLHHDGTYHLFFQTNPRGSTWGNISWGHATSTDLLTWDERPVAIPCTDEEQAFSGSAVVDAANTAGFAGPGETALVAIYTSQHSASSDRPGVQAQSLAHSTDGGETWTRYPGNPVLDTGSTDFRDPKVFWHAADAADGADGIDGGRWVMVAVEAVERRVTVHSSPDLLHWSLESRFGPAHAVGGVWECPDLFPLAARGTGRVRWVLLVSLNPGAVAGGSGTQYFVGDFDGSTFTPERVTDDPAGFDWLDHGRDLYAGVTFNGAPDGRRLLVGWVNNWDYAELTPTGPWRSSLSLVRELELVLGPDGRHRLHQRPVLPPAGTAVRVVDVVVASGPRDRTRVVLESEGGADAVVLVVDGGAGTVTCDRTRSGNVGFHPGFAGVDTAPTLGGASTRLQVVLDGSVLEVFVDGGASSLTQQVFPASPLSVTRVEPLAADG